MAVCGKCGKSYSAGYKGKKCTAETVVGTTMRYVFGRGVVMVPVTGMCNGSIIATEAELLALSVEAAGQSVMERHRRQMLEKKQARGRRAARATKRSQRNSQGRRH